MLNQGDCTDRWDAQSQPAAPGGSKSVIYQYKYICFLTNDKGTRDLCRSIDQILFSLLMPKSSSDPL